jgi:hypothetical protein
MRRNKPAPPADQQPIGEQSVANPQVIRTLPKGARAAAIRRDIMKYPGLGPAALARRAGCTTSNASQVLKSFLTVHTNEQLLDYQQNRADIYDSMQYRILESVTDEKINKMPVQAAVLSAAILHDKAALLRGQATGINVSVLLDVASMIRRDD